MSSSSPSPTASTSPSSLRASDTRIAHYAAILGVVACPILLLAPPRKVDLYTFTAAGIGLYCGNYLVQERNHGVGIMDLAGERLGFVVPAKRRAQTEKERAQGHLAGTDPFSPAALRESALHAQPGHEGMLERMSLPTERARSLHEALAADREAAQLRRRRYLDLRRQDEALRHVGWGTGGDVRQALQQSKRQVEEDALRHGWPAPPPEEMTPSTQTSARHEEILASAIEGSDARRASARRDGSKNGGSDGDGSDSSNNPGGVSGVVHRVWMGSEKPGWADQRLKEEQQALDEGRGYGDLIFDQIWEVWNWDKKKDENGDWVPKKQSK